MVAKLKDLTGLQFGQFKVIRREGSRRFGNGKTRPTWLLECPNGHQEIRSTASLDISKGNTKCYACCAIHGKMPNGSKLKVEPEAAE